MECYFINNINVPFIDKKRKGEIYDKFIDKYFIPADVVCIAGGISENLNITSTFLIKLAQKYSNVIYIYGGCDLVSDISLDFKFQEIKRSFKTIQKTLCRPINLDGEIINVESNIIGGFTGFDMSEDLSKWNWWTDDKNEFMNFEKTRFNRIKDKNLNIILSYYKPEAMNITEKFDIWHYGYGNEKNIIDNNGKLLITNSCHAESTKFSKKDFLIKI